MGQSSDIYAGWERQTVPQAEEQSEGGSEQDLSDEGTVRHELAVDAVEDGLEVIALPGVLGIKQFQKASNEVRVNVLARHFCLCRPRHDEAQEELPDATSASERKRALRQLTSGPQLSTEMYRVREHNL